MPILGNEQVDGSARRQVKGEAVKGAFWLAELNERKAALAIAGQFGRSGFGWVQWKEGLRTTTERLIENLLNVLCNGVMVAPFVLQKRTLPRL